jgi:hypothetical protein
LTLSVSGPSTSTTSPLARNWLTINAYKDDPAVQAQIAAYLADAQSFTIPYRCNRAVLFHSTLFHKTDPFHFRDGYENRRTNFTMLFGRRGQESAALRCHFHNACRLHGKHASSMGCWPKRNGRPANKPILAGRMTNGQKPNVAEDNKLADRSYVLIAATAWYESGSVWVGLLASLWACIVKTPVYSLHEHFWGELIFKKPAKPGLLETTRPSSSR